MHKRVRGVDACNVDDVWNVNNVWNVHVCMCVLARTCVCVSVCVYVRVRVCVHIVRVRVCAYRRHLARFVASSRGGVPRRKRARDRSFKFERRCVCVLRVCARVWASERARVRACVRMSARACMICLCVGRTKQQHVDRRQCPPLIG